MQVDIGHRRVGEGYLTAIMGIINVSPSSFYTGSVRTDSDQVRKYARHLAQVGAEIIDLGAASTASYLGDIGISEEEESRRLCSSLAWVKETVALPVSVDTRRGRVADEAIRAGADMINDISGLKFDNEMARVIAKHGVPVILGAFEREKKEGLSPIHRVCLALTESLETAASFGIDKIIVDPAIGFFRSTGIPWYIWDLSVINELKQLKELGRPVCIGLSRKSFLGKLLEENRPEARVAEVNQRLFASLSAEAIAVFNGAHMIRTHDVKACREVAKVAGGIRDIKVKVNREK